MVLSPDAPVFIPQCNMQEARFKDGIQQQILATEVAMAVEYSSDSRKISANIPTKLVRKLRSAKDIIYQCTNNWEKTMIIMRGLPSSGKSYFAR